jgi:hypothetical protein
MKASVDVAEFEEANSTQRRACWFSLLPFTDEQREKLELVCDHRPDMKHKAISMVLAKWKFEVADGSVARHRTRECKCPPGKNGQP